MDPHELAGMIDSLRLGASGQRTQQGSTFRNGLNMPLWESRDDMYDDVNALVKQVEAARVRWDKERRAKPKPADLAPKAALIVAIRFEQYSMALESADDDRHKYLQTTIGHEINFSNTSVENLSPSECFS